MDGREELRLDAVSIAALRALVDPGRLRLVGLLAIRPMTREALGVAVHQAPTALIKPLEQLIGAELVEARPGKGGALFALRADRIGQLARLLATLDRGADDAAAELAALAGVSTDDARVLRHYLEDGRLTTIPAQASKRLVVLRWLRDQVFAEDRDYPEKEVNQRIALIHPDPAALRRYLVDERLVTRANGVYRRLD
jgi:DNA-binding transcriptional ArsR family regulator